MYHKNLKPMDLLAKMTSGLKLLNILIVLTAAITFSFDFSGSNAYFISPKVRSGSAAVFTIQKILPKALEMTEDKQPVPIPSQPADSVDPGDIDNGEKSPEAPDATGGADTSGTPEISIPGDLGTSNGEADSMKETDIPSDTVNTSDKTDKPDEASTSDKNEEAAQVDEGGY